MDYLSSVVESCIMINGTEHETRRHVYVYVLDSQRVVLEVTGVKYDEAADVRAAQLTFYELLVRLSPVPAVFDVIQ